MRFYNRQHRHYCGIDLHVKTMYLCILDAGGQVLVHRNVKSTPDAFLETIAPYRDDLVVAAECMFTQVRHENGQRSANPRESVQEVTKSPLHSAFHSRWAGMVMSS